MSRLALLIVACVLAAANSTTPVPAAADLLDPPTTQPTAALPAELTPSSASRVDTALQADYDKLADADPSVRDSARERLMGLTCDRLPDLLAVVRAAGHPPRPDQSVALREIVTQVYLAAELYRLADPPRPPDEVVEGPPWPVVDVRQFVMGIRWRDRDFATSRAGVPVVDRWPGFPAYRRLRDGDLILGIWIDAGRPLSELPNRVFYKPDQLRSAIDNLPGVRDVVLAVLRDGRTIRVPITMAPRPSGLLTADMFLIDRQMRADTYWHDTFAPLIPPGPGDNQ